MSESTELKFDPEWPHGHLVIESLGRIYPAKILAVLKDSLRPYVVLVNAGGRGWVESHCQRAACALRQQIYKKQFDHRMGSEWITHFRADGWHDNEAVPRIINAPAPEPTVVRVEKRGA